MSGSLKHGYLRLKKTNTKGARYMTNLNPWQGVMTLLSLVDGFIKVGISGIRKKFTRENFLKVEYIELKNLKVDKKYQRLINLNFIKKAKEFRPKLVKPLSVFKRPNGDYFIVDGQHTACLAGVYVEDSENFKLPCQVQLHPLTFTIEQCEEAEATYFKEFNFLRNNVSTIEKLRADIARGVEYATNMLEKLQSLNVHVQGIGDETGEEVFGYEKLKTSLGKYGSTYTKMAVELIRYHVGNKNSKWKKPKDFDGSMILGLAAAYHFNDVYLGDAGKSKGFQEYLIRIIAAKDVATWKTKTAGQVQDLLLLEKILEHYNSVIELDAGILDAPKIGMKEKSESLFNQWLGDPIHGNGKESEDSDN